MSNSPVRSDRARRHTGHGFIHQQEFGVLGHQHAEFEPLFFAVSEDAGFLVGLGLQADDAEDFVDAILAVLFEGRQQRMKDAARIAQREPEVFQHGQGFEDVGRLEFAPDAHAGNFRFVAAGNILGWPLIGLENHGASRRLDLAGNDIEQRRFAGAVGPDDDAQFAAVDRKVQLVQRLEAAEVHGEIVHLDDFFRDGPGLDFHGFHSSNSGLFRPAQATDGKLNNLPHQPDDSLGHEEHDRDEQCAENHRPDKRPLFANQDLAEFNQIRMPRMAPTSVPRPPTATQMTAMMEKSICKNFGPTE